MSELFKLKPCEECNGTGDAHYQGHDYDCPDCLGTGYEEPAKRIMNLELMLNQHKETLKSGDAYNNELAQKFEITLEQRDRLAGVLNRIANNNVQDLPETNYAYELGRMEGIAKMALKSLTLTQPEPK